MGMHEALLSTQRGITLITCMIMLIILTLLGLASIEDTSLEEKMAGNMRSRNLAFQAAESALRQGENYILSVDPVPAFDGTGGFYPEMDSVLTAMAASWGISSAVRSYAGETLDNLAAQPVYIIENVDALFQSTSIDATNALENRSFFRVTARALGGTATTEVILQSIVKR
jgi:type IV pilus assembly protein PilX